MERSSEGEQRTAHFEVTAPRFAKELKIPFVTQHRSHAVDQLALKGSEIEAPARSSLSQWAAPSARLAALNLDNGSVHGPKRSSITVPLGSSRTRAENGVRAVPCSVRRMPVTNRMSVQRMTAEPSVSTNERAAGNREKPR
jgi:hypothetical protein